MATLLSVREITLRFGGIVALDGVSFDVESGQISGLIGPNGAGKTTAFNVITRLYTPDEGELELDGASLLQTPAYRIVERGIARTFQNINLFKSMSVLENVLLGAYALGRGVKESDALGRGVDLTRLSTGQGETAAPAANAKSVGAIVLLSDGTQTHGVLTPEDGARLAKEAGIPVYTIALGTLTGTVTIDRNGSQVIVPVPPDRKTLASIAESTGGSAFDVTDAQKLSSVYDRLGKIVATTSKPREVTAAFVAVAAALLTIAIGIAALSAPRLP